MINAKVKVIQSNDEEWFEELMNGFLSKIDVRQIVKTEYSTSSSTKFSAMIYYVGIDDIRDAKIENILEIK